MKTIIFALAFTLSVLNLRAADITPVSEIIRSGKAELLKDKMSDEVEISVPGTSAKGSGSEAILVLKAFFGANKVSGFNVVHHADKNESGFIVGKLATDTGAFRVNITYTTKDDKLLIQIIRIE